MTSTGVSSWISLCPFAIVNSDWGNAQAAHCINRFSHDMAHLMMMLHLFYVFQSYQDVGLYSMKGCSSSEKNSLNYMKRDHVIQSLEL